MLFMRSTPDQGHEAHHIFQNTQACLQTFGQNYKDTVADNHLFKNEIPASILKLDLSSFFWLFRVSCMYISMNSATVCPIRH